MDNKELNRITLMKEAAKRAKEKYLNASPEEKEQIILKSKDAIKKFREKLLEAQKGE